MHSLLARHGKTKVLGGPLKDATYDSLDIEKLRKVAKRYSGDPQLVKFARACVLLEELNGREDPAPCMVLVPKPPAEPAEAIFSMGMFRSTCKTLWASMLLRCLTIFLVVAFLSKPSFSMVTCKMFVASVRLILRRFLSLFTMILEGFVDELVYQIEYSVREALPADTSISEVARSSYHFGSHLVSGCLGALVTLLVSLRKAQGG